MGDILNGCIALSSTELPLPARTQPCGTLWKRHRRLSPAPTLFLKKLPKYVARNMCRNGQELTKKSKIFYRAQRKPKMIQLIPKLWKLQKTKNDHFGKVCIVDRGAVLVSKHLWFVYRYLLCVWVRLKGWCRGWVALHYNRPRATSGIHGVAGRVRYRLCQYRGDRKSMPSPCQVADVPLGQLEIKCFNILVSQTTSRIS